MIGEALRLIRIFHDTSLTEMANALGVSASYLSDVENDKKNPNLKVVENYALHFGVRPSSILFFAEEIDGSSFASNAKAAIREKMIKLMQVMERYGHSEPGL